MTLPSPDPVHICRHYLQMLDALLAKLAQQAAQRAPASPAAEQQLLCARLCDDMFAFCQQVTVVVSFALRTCLAAPQQQLAPCNGWLAPGEPMALADLRQYVQQALALFDQAEPAQSPVQDQAGFRALQWPLAEYQQLFALPNFFFHLSMVYAIAKTQGYALSKGDYDGIHQYPAGFSWETPDPTTGG